MQLEADRLVIKRYSPPGVLIDANLRILQFRGATNPYLRPAAGRATFDLLKMAREGLAGPLRILIERAKKTGRPAREEMIPLNGEGTPQRFTHIEIIPLSNLTELCFLVLFEDVRLPIGEVPVPTLRDRAPKPRRLPPAESARLIAHLERMLAETRDYLKEIGEQHAAANERLFAAHEEIQAANEELQSFNEELETSKEQLQSANEELSSANEELELRVAQRTAELDSALNRLRKLAQRLVRVQEDERRSILTELQEEIGQQLVGLRLLLGAGANLAQEGKVFHRTASLVSDIQARVSALSSALHPIVPDFLTLRAFLERHFNHLAQTARLKVQFNCQGLKEDDLDGEIRQAIFRIAQDTLSNVVRHARTRKASVSIVRAGQEVSLEVSDCGVGFRVDTPRSSSSHGISGIEERVLLLGGNFRLTSSPGQGTRMLVTLPCSIQDETPGGEG